MNRANEIRRNLLGEAAITEAPKSRWNAQIQRKVCEVCGNQIVKDLEVHHIEERAKGGSNKLRNLVVLCEVCHDKHHNNELIVGPIRQTSDGEERVIQIQKDTKEIVQENSPEASVVEKPKSGKGSKGSERPEDEMTKIVTIVAKYKGRPLTRTILALEEEGIHMKQAELKRIITKL
jgi:hypothetical protein